MAGPAGSAATPSLQSQVVTLFQAKASKGSVRRMRNFPGMKEITLEKLVCRAHEGLGHPDNNRLVRILRQSHSDRQGSEMLCARILPST